jgi:hypothetical protein
LHWLNTTFTATVDRAGHWWCRYHLVNPVVRRYASTAGTQTMLWVVATVRTHASAVADLAPIVEIAQRWRTGWGALEPFRPVCVESMQSHHASLEDYFLQCWGSARATTGPEQAWACIGEPHPDRTEAFQAFRAQLPPELRAAFEAASQGTDPASAQTLRQLMKAGVRADPVALYQAGVRVDRTLEPPPFVPHFEDGNTRLPQWRSHVRAVLAANRARAHATAAAPVAA